MSRIPSTQGRGAQVQTQTSAWRHVLGGVLAAGVGALAAAQSLVNGTFAERSGGGLGGGTQAALVSFGVGLLLLCTAVLVWRSGRHGVASVFRALRLRKLRPWQVIGGAFGAFVVLSQSITVSVIGVALFTVAMVAGQGISSLLVDRAGIGPGGAQAVTTGRTIGASLSVVAVGLAVVSQVGGPDSLSVADAAFVVLPLLAGAGTAWQQAVNGRVAVVGGSLAATWVNFVVGGLILTIAFFVVRIAIGAAEPLPALIGPSSWLYFGGVIGVAFIAMSAVLVRVLGVLLLGLCSFAGQVLASLAFDVIAGRPLGALTVIGAGLTLVGVVVAGLSTRFRRRNAIVAAAAGSETAAESLAES